MLVPSYQLEAARSPQGVNARADPKGAAARGFLLPELTASSVLMRGLREHLRGHHRPCPAAWTSYIIQGILQPWGTLPFVMVVRLSYGHRREVLSELTAYWGREALALSPVAASLLSQTPLLTMKCLEPRVFLDPLA